MPSPIQSVHPDNASPFVKYQPDAQGRMRMHGLTPMACRLVRLAVRWSAWVTALRARRKDRRSVNKSA